MNKAALFTSGKKLGGGSAIYLLSVFDLEPSGVIVHAYNQINSAEYLLPVSEADLARAGITRAPASLSGLIESIVLVPKGAEFELQSTLETVSDNKKRLSGEEVEGMIKSPLKRDAEESIHSLITSGLVELCKVKPVGIDAVEFLGEWLLKNNPNRPVVQENYEVDEAL